MQDHQREALLDATRHLVTLAFATLGFVITIMFTSLGGEPLLKATPYKNSLQTALVALLIAVVVGFLTQATLLGHVLAERNRIPLARPRILFGLTWIAFVTGVVAFFVFAWATAFGGAPLGLFGS